MTDVPITFNLHDLVARAAARRPERIAVRQGAESLTYGELDHLATELARKLVELGVRPGDRVGTYQPKSARGVAALIGILRAGAAYVPVDPQAPPERARWILEHAGARVLFAAGRPLDEARRAGVQLAGVLLTPGAVEARPVAEAALDLLVPGEAVAPPLPAVADGELAYLLYTSGSTGTPKGVAITHGQALAFVRPAVEVFEVGPADVLASHAPFNFDLSVIDLYCAFAVGAEVVLIPETALAFPARVAQLVEAARITLWNSVPSALIALTPHLEGRDLAALRLVMFAGEPYPVRALRALRAALPGARLLNVYGQTEANSSTYHEIRALPEVDDAPVPIGRTFPNYDVLLLDEAGSLIDEPGLEGELFVVSSAVAAGYWRDPDRTALSFVPHPLRPERRQTVYRTGDRASRNSDGDLVFRGRADFAVKVRGFRVELGELEAVARTHAGVADAVAVPVPHQEHGNALALFVTLEGGAPLDASALLSSLGQRLPRYMLPSAIRVLEALPHTGTGKVDRKALRHAAEEALSGGSA